MESERRRRQSSGAAQTLLQATCPLLPEAKLHEQSQGLAASGCPLPVPRYVRLAPARRAHLSPSSAPPCQPVAPVTTPLHTPLSFRFSGHKPAPGPLDPLATASRPTARHPRTRRSTSPVASQAPASAARLLSQQSVPHEPVMPCQPAYEPRVRISTACRHGKPRGPPAGASAARWPARPPPCHPARLPACPPSRVRAPCAATSAVRARPAVQWGSIVQPGTGRTGGTTGVRLDSSRRGVKASRDGGGGGGDGSSGGGAAGRPWKALL